ncbi:MAG: hypothetical protein K2P99_00215, partial [Burkholderiales bacterium]|nr:hypothetical protein [Burkholderiales bacterium]
SFSNSYECVRQSDILICCYGTPSIFPLPDRNLLINDHIELTKIIFNELCDYIHDKIMILNVVNPVDIISNFICNLVNIPKQQLLGISGSHNTARLLVAIEKETNISIDKIDKESLIVCGEHGDAIVPIMSNIKIQGKYLTDLVPSSTIDIIIANTKAHGLSIFHDKKSPPVFSPSASVMIVLNIILSRSTKIFSGSVWNDQYGCFLSWPIQIIEKAFHTLNITYSPHERMQLESCATKLRQYQENIKS